MKATIMGVLVLTLCRATDIKAQVQQCATPSSELRVDRDGTVHIPAYELPLSTYMSKEAKRAYIEARTSPAVELPTDTVKLRKTLDRVFYAPRLQRAEAVYPVIIEEKRIAGVRTDVVIPKEGVSIQNQDRVLINLHGGGMKVGGGMGGLLESVPFAAVGKIEVISVDYREAPESRFPAASEDVAAVYKELLHRYEARNIGIYGCSAGGELTAMVVAWLQKQQLPSPGAVGIFCEGATYEVAGDSAYTAAPLIEFLGARVLPPLAHPDVQSMRDPYLGKVGRNNPLVAPALFPETLAKFPPTLLITGSRDIAMSATIHTHAELVKAGVDAELHVWDGMWHSFFSDVDLPESQEVYAVTARFFDAHLGKSR